MHGITSYIYLIIVIFLIGIFIFGVITDKDFQRIKSLSVSTIALSLIGLNWILYLFNFYVFIPDKISDLIFLPIWFLVCFIGLFAAFKEYKNNLFIAYITGGLSIITLMFGGVLLLIGRA